MGLISKSDPGDLGSNLMEAVAPVVGGGDMLKSSQLRAGVA